MVVIKLRKKVILKENGKVIKEEDISFRDETYIYTKVKYRHTINENRKKYNRKKYKKTVDTI